MSPNNRNTPKDKVLLGKSLSKLEKIFTDLGSNTQPFEIWIEDLLDSPFWVNKNSDLTTIKDICISVAKEQDFMFSGTTEPKYHNRNHFKDVCCSMTELLQAQNDILPPLDGLSPWQISDHDSLILLLCAICHDLGHDGTTNKYPFELEKKSIGLVQEHLESTSLSLFERKEIINTIEPIILATDPKYLPTLLDKFNSEKNIVHSDCVSMLMVEADLLASALPKKGEILGQRLSEEWQLTNPEAATSVKTKKGRLQFLQHIRFISPQAQALGIEDIRKISIDQVKE